MLVPQAHPTNALRQVCRRRPTVVRKAVWTSASVAAAPSRTWASVVAVVVGGGRADNGRGTVARAVGAATQRAPTLAASNACCSNGSCSPDSSPLFSHSDTESV